MIIHYIDINLELWYNCTLKNIMDKPIQSSEGNELLIRRFLLNESETRRFPLELVYPLCFVEYNCTTSQVACLNYK